MERYKSIKKYYDEYYGVKQKETQAKSKNSSDLFEKLIGETYDIRIELEQHLEDFILKCYDTYIYNGTDYKRIKNLMTEYQDLMHQKNPHYIVSNHMQFQLRFHLFHLFFVQTINIFLMKKISQ